MSKWSLPTRKVCTHTATKKENPHTNLSKKSLSKAATQIRDGVWEWKKRFHTIVSGFIPDGSSERWVPWSTPVDTLQTPLFPQLPHHGWWWFSDIVKRGKKTKRPIEFHAGDQSRGCKYWKATQKPQKSGFRASEDWWTFIQSIVRIFLMYLE
jgi:hypothetical protein